MHPALLELRLLLETSGVCEGQLDLLRENQAEKELRRNLIRIINGCILKLPSPVKNQCADLIYQYLMTVRSTATPVPL